MTGGTYQNEKKKNEKVVSNSNDGDLIELSSLTTKESRNPLKEITTANHIDNFQEDDNERAPLCAIANTIIEGNGEGKRQLHESPRAANSNSSSIISHRNNSSFSSLALLFTSSSAVGDAEEKRNNDEGGSECSGICGGGNRIGNSNIIKARAAASTMPFLAAAATALGSIREERDEDAENEDQDYNPDPIMNVMDYLEDEIDEHTYDEIIPLQLRMALEDSVFGWDHFLSSLLGHVGYTIGSYLLAFWLITFVVLRDVPWKTSGQHDYYNKTDFGSEHKSHGLNKNNPWGMPHELFSVIRTSLALASAISTFRTIRRRRRVWLRHPSSPRQQELLLEADQRARRFVFSSEMWSRMRKSYAKRRDRYLARKVHRKLLGAQRMFEQRQRNRIKLIRSLSASSLMSEDGGDDTTVASSSGCGIDGEPPSVSSVKSKGFLSPTQSGHENAHHQRVRILATSPGIASRDDDTAIHKWQGPSSVSDKSIGVSVDDDYRYHSGSLHNHRHNYQDSHTLPNFAMESVSHDQMPFAHGEIKKIPYVHGGFFGAAPFMLTNPHWISILRLLMPDVYVEISRRASYAPAPRLIHWAENNPVVAAYGTAHEIEFSGIVPTLEWDVFLDPHLVRRVEIVLTEKEAFLERQKDDFRNSISGHQMSARATSTSSTDERLVLSYYDREIKRRTSILVERMLIAHGNMLQLVLEQTGYLKRYNFSRVKRTRKTLGGGIFCKQWLSIYSEAMKLGMGCDKDDGFDDDVSTDSGTDSSLEERSEIDFADFSQLDNDNLAVGERKGNPSPSSVKRGITGPNLKSTARSRDICTSALNSSCLHVGDKHEGLPRKIVMMRSNDNENDENMSTEHDGISIQSELLLSPSKSGRTIKRKSESSKRKRSRSRSLTSAPVVDRNTSIATSLHMASACPDKSISESISLLRSIIRCSAPFGLVLDMKSRHVSRKVWALVVDYLRGAGVRVEGIASFFVEEVRDITQYCSSSVNEFVFTHSAGDIQHGCHSGKIKYGDRVFFNAGSLLWDFPNIYDFDVWKNILLHRFHPVFDEQDIKEGYRLKPYALIRNSSSRVGSPTPVSRGRCDSGSETCGDESILDDGDSINSDVFTRLLLADTKKKSLSEVDFVYEEPPEGVCCSTIQQYKDRYHLSLGVYVQEFAIDEVAISLIVKYVNSNSHVYNLGLSWGGINGLTVKGIQPGRFTATDGFWNQRYGGMPWRKELHPGETALQ